ncbi:MAG: hypothetical protein RQM92_17455 [Candidatus Syntrophopropionicum ammoniitolerans]
MKKRVIIVLLTAALTLSFAAVANSTTGAKMIEATYRGIILMTNGDMVTLGAGYGGIHLLSLKKVGHMCPFGWRQKLWGITWNG